MIALLRTALTGFVRDISGSPDSRFHQLRALRELDERMLRDIGLTREDVLRGAPPPEPAPDKPQGCEPLCRESATC